VSGEILDGARIVLDAGPEGLEVHWENPREAEEPEREAVPAGAAS
jgi:hypothetical protein